MQDKGIVPNLHVYRYILFIGSLKAGFVTERSELGSCRAFGFQYPILNEVHVYRYIYCLLESKRD